MNSKAKIIDVILILFFLLGLFASLSINQFIYGLGFGSISLLQGAYISTKKYGGSNTVIQINKFIRVSFLAVIALSLFFVTVKLILTMVLGNTWGIMIFEYGNNIFRIIIIGLSFAALITTYLNIHHLIQKNK